MASGGCRSFVGFLPRQFGGGPSNISRWLVPGVCLLGLISFLIDGDPVECFVSFWPRGVVVSALCTYRNDLLVFLDNWGLKFLHSKVVLLS